MHTNTKNASIRVASLPTTYYDLYTPFHTTTSTTTILFIMNYSNHIESVPIYNQHHSLSISIYPLFDEVVITHTSGNIHDERSS